MRSFTLTAALCVFIASQAHAQLAMTWYSIDCGGSTAASGPFFMQGTFGQLDAGVQTAGPFTFRGGFVQSFRPPCPADFNRDTGVDFFDYLDFIDAFSAGSADADFNHDGAIDFFDYLDFVDAFSIGC